MSWRSAMRRTRQRPRNTLANSDSWNNNANRVTEAPNDSNQIGMHVRVLRYHEIRLGNIEKQLAKLSRQLSSFPSSVKQRTNVKNKSDTAAENTEPVNQLQGVLKNLAAEVASSNKMIKQFITGDNIGFKKAELKTREIEKTIIEKKIDETQTMEWKIARARLVRCGMRATDERIRDMVSTMKEEIDLVTDILENHTENLEKEVEEAVVKTEKNTEIQIKENHSEEDIKSTDTSEDDSEEETVDISTSADIGYVPVHVVVKKKRGRPKKKKNNAK